MANMMKFTDMGIQSFKMIIDYNLQHGEIPEDVRIVDVRQICCKGG